MNFLGKTWYFSIDFSLLYINLNTDLFIFLVAILIGPVKVFICMQEELYQMVMRMVFESYGVGDFETQMESTTVLLRCLKYRAPQLNETNRGLRGHTDKNFLSILHQNHVGGLEIKVKDEEWVTFESTPSSFLFLAGDGLVVIFSM